jgi:acetyltransferase-like isoleucine patch superfamily enzyme
MNFIENVDRSSVINRPCKLLGGGQKSLFIGKHTKINSYCVFGLWKKYGNKDYDPHIRIGNNCNIGEYNHFTAIGSIIIGDGLLTGRFVTISDNNHGRMDSPDIELMPVRRDLTSKGDVVIGDNVWIADKVTILSGVHIGNNTIIGANAVVTKDIPANCIAVGNPAKVVKRIYNDDEKN